MKNTKKNEGNTISVSTQNRFEALSNIGPPDSTPTDEIVEEQPTDFLTYLRRKNSQDGTSKKKTQAVIQTTRKTQQKTDLAATQQRIRKKDKPPPINILYQDPRDTTKLLKDNVSDFYIKGISGGKHMLQTDNFANFKLAKDLLVKRQILYIHIENRKTDKLSLKRFR